MRVRLFTSLCGVALLAPLGFLFWLVVRMAIDALPRDPVLSLITPSLFGSFYLFLLTAVIALPVGLSTAVYLEEYAKPSRLKRLVELNINNLASVPAIIYGLLGVAVFVPFFGRSLLTAALTLTLLLLPMLVIVAREALRTVPDALRESALALGAPKIEVIRRVVLPMALPNMLTGVIVSLARGLGEVAPLLAVGALTLVTFAPSALTSPFSAVPLQVFAWLGRPEPGYQHAAAGAILVLLCLMLLLNGVALWLRLRLQRRY